MKNNISKYKVGEIVGVVILCMLLVVGATLGVIFGMNMPSEDLNDVGDVSTDPILMETVEAKNISLLSGVATTAADGTVTKTVTATVTPANVVQYDKLIWTASFENASSTWATGKNISDYVTISVSDDSLTCNVTCKKAFSESVVINVKDTLDSANATLHVEYYKILTSYQVEIRDENGDSQILSSSNANEEPAATMFASLTSSVPSYTLTYSFTFSDGTVENSVGFVWSSRSGRTNMSNGQSFQFDEQSTEQWEFDTYYVDLSYGGVELASWQVVLVSPMSSISLSESTITF